MNRIKLKDKSFELSITETAILEQVRRVGSELNRDFAGKRPLFITVLNGAFVFAADLFREINMPSEIRFVRLASYSGMNSEGEVKELLGFDIDVKDRDVVIVEDIVDSGLTMKKLLGMLWAKSPNSVSIATLLVKPANLKTDVEIRYKCFEIPNDFIVGYGLDYDDLGRNLRSIYTVRE